LFEVLRRWLEGELDYTADELVAHCSGFLGSLAAYVLLDNDPAKGSTSNIAKV
jgi:hypothetical protein